MQPLSALTEERETTQQDHTRDRIGRLHETSAREIMVNETLGAETGEQALSDTLLQMQVDSVLVEYTCVFEDDRSDRRFAAPLGELLVLLAGRAQRVKRVSPAGVGPRSAVKGWENPDRASLFVSSLVKRIGTE
jgi:hypothetical protein